MKKGEIAEALFKEGYSCAQAVVLTFSEEMNTDRETLARLVSSFGGGMGRLREVCGAVSGMFIAAGAIKGYASPDDQAGKAELYRLVQQMAEEFKARNGSLICRQLLGLNAEKDDYHPEKRTESYYASRPCAKLVRDAAEIAEQMLLTEESR
ncbi:MAG: C-GCAxxG-C-C family protein [Anaerovoracaceae bacterium]